MAIGRSLVVAILALPLAAPDAVSARSSAAPVCVSSSVVEGPQALEDGTIVFRGLTRSNPSWLGHFRGGRCPTMTKFSTVIVARVANRYCEGDLVRAVNPPSGGPGPACAIVRLTQVPPDKASQEAILIR